MKIEPRKIKKTLKYAAVGACVATSLISTGCDVFDVQLTGDVPQVVTPTPESNFAGVMPAVPMPTIPPNGKYGTLPEKTKTPEDEEVILSGDVATTPAPELAGGIFTPEPEYDDVQLAGAPPAR